MSDQFDIRVIIIDDRPDEARALGQELGAAAGVFGPDELATSDLRDADVVLVDYDLSEWEVAIRDDDPARSPADGLALAAVLRSHAMPDYREGRPVAFALHSSQLQRIGGNLAQEIREHAIARVHNLEWVFDKKAGGEVPPLADRVRELAEAVRSLPDDWPSEPGAAMDVLAALLGWRDGRPGAGLAREQILRCHPPLHELSAATDGLTCLRWLAHRILPYPCFLYDERHVGVRLGLEAAEIRQLGEERESELSQALAVCRYDGVLKGFVGPRWWRASLDYWLWDLGEGDAPAGEELHALLEERAGRELRSLGILDPVVVLGPTYQSLPTPASATDAVRIQPDDWPPFADDAWTTLELVADNSRLRDLVVPDDRDLVDEASGA